MGHTLVAGFSFLSAAGPTLSELNDKLTLDSTILSEQFYYWTVVVMWLIHVGFMSYESGASRRKNVMTTAMKNITPMMNQGALAPMAFSAIPPA